MNTYRSLLLFLISAAILILVPQLVIAGPPEKPGNPGVPGLLAEIAYLQSVISDQQDIIDELEELLDQLQSSAPVQQTGATQSFFPGDDGDINAGVQWPDPRFTDNGDGTVTDNLTGLIWLKNANCFNYRSWYSALTDSNNLASGQCGLSDDSVAEEWRLPNIREIQSLIDYGRLAPTLPAGHPFTGVMTTSYYWSSTTYVGNIDYAWVVNLEPGNVPQQQHKFGNAFYVWPVRSDN